MKCSALKVWFDMLGNTHFPEWKRETAILALSKSLKSHMPEPQSSLNSTSELVCLISTKNNKPAYCVTFRESPASYFHQFLVFMLSYLAAGSSYIFIISYLTLNIFSKMLNSS